MTLSDGNGIVGNDGDNIITVTGGADAVSGGLGTDRLVVDYRLASGAITGNSTTNVAEAGGLGIVTITNGRFEHFTILTGSGADTITTGAGDDIINTGEGASTVTAGQVRTASPAAAAPTPSRPSMAAISSTVVAATTF